MKRILIILITVIVIILGFYFIHTKINNTIIENMTTNNHDWRSIIKTYQDNLTSTDSIDERMKRFSSLLSSNPILLINFKNFSSAPTMIGEVPDPKFLQGKSVIESFQKNAYMSNKWTNLSYKVVKKSIGKNL